MAIATLNAVFAYTGLLGCIFSPKKFGSSILFLSAIQDIFWSFLIVSVGGFTVGESFGLKNAVERVNQKKSENQRREQENYARSEKECHGEREQEHYGQREIEGHSSIASGASGGQYTDTTSHSGPQQERRHTRSSVSTSSGFGNSGFGTGVQKHSVGSGNEGPFRNQGLKTEAYRGIEPHQ